MESDIGTIGTWVALILTLMIYCYLGKDIPFFHFIYRVAAFVFVGVALGYGVVIAWHSVLVPRLWLRLEGGQWWYIVPLVLCLLLLTRVKRSWGGLGSVTIAFVLGVGAALSIGGGIVGTLLPQVASTFVSLNPGDYEVIADREGSLTIVYVLNALLVVIGTIATLMYFYFGASNRTPGRVTPGIPDAPRRGLLSLWTGPRDQVLQLSIGFGKVFMMFTFGALFAAAAISRISLLADRVRFMIETLWSLLGI
jgi:hypothetical protein